MSDWGECVTCGKSYGSPTRETAAAIIGAGVSLGEFFRKWPINPIGANSPVADASTILLAMLDDKTVVLDADRYLTLTT